jgi:peptidoglycan/LPS O-acetylase OafA/YrhL
VLPVIWAVFTVCMVGGFITIVAYWLDVQDRPDFTFRQRLAWSLGILLFPVVIPAYAVVGGPGWPRPLMIGAFLPAVALLLAGALATGRFS